MFYAIAESLYKSEFIQILQCLRDSAKNEMFDGLIGILTFVYQEEAKRNSKNRPKGTHKEH